MSALIPKIIDISTSSSDRSLSPPPNNVSQASLTAAAKEAGHQEGPINNAVSRVSLANLLGPDGPGSSPHPNSPRTSPRKRLSDASRPDKSPPHQHQLSNGTKHAQASHRPETSDAAGPSRTDTSAVKPELSNPKPHEIVVDAVMTDAPPDVQDAGEHDHDHDHDDDDDEDDDDEDEDDDDDSATDAGSATEGEVAATGEPNSTNDAAPNAEEGPSETPLIDGDAAAVSRKRPRRRSPSLEAPQGAPAPKRPTVRLSILGARQGGYMINVPELVLADLKGKGHPWAKWYEEAQMETADPEADPPKSSTAPAGAGPELEGFGGLAKLLAKYPTTEDGATTDGAASKKRRRGNQEDKYDIGQYDVRDPFVDDSELNIDEPTHFAKPKADGFYVTKGTVELAKHKGVPEAQLQTAKDKAKPLSIRDSKQGFAGSINRLIARKAQQGAGLPPMPASTPSMHVDALLNTTPTPTDHGGASALANASQMHGTRDSPIKVDDIDSQSAKAAAKKNNRYPTRPVDPRLQSAFDDLKKAVDQENFAVKTKFPTSLKPPLIETAKLAVMLGQYDENFFNHLPTIFPYNRFTMMKLVKREFFPHHIKYFEDLKQEHLDKLGRMLRDALPTQKAEHEAAHQAWVERGEAPKEADANSSSNVDQARDHEPMDVDGQKAVDDESAEPLKRWRWTEDMREEVFVLITIENATSEIRNEKLKLENAVEQYSEINARKACYKQMAELFPEEGWTTSTNISREYAQLKKKKDRQEARGEDVFADSRASSVVPA